MMFLRFCLGNYIAEDFIAEIRAPLEVPTPIKNVLSTTPGTIPHNRQTHPPNVNPYYPFNNSFHVIT